MIGATRTRHDADGDRRPLFASAIAHAQFPGENGVIAFGRLTSAVDGIATIDAPGDDPTLLTVARGFDRHPSYSRDGSRIAFIRGTRT